MLGIDVSEPLLGQARTRLDPARHGHVELLRADAAVHPFTPESFDVVVSRLGLTFFDEPTAAFRNLAGALRPAGRLSFVCWQAAAANEWIRLPWDAVAAHLPLPPEAENGTPSPFAFANPRRVRKILEAAGFVDLRVDAMALPVIIGDDVDDVAGFYLDNELTAVRRLPRSLGKRIERTLREKLQQRSTRHGVVLEAAAWLVTASLPG